MGYGFFRPTKYKILLFVLLSAMLFYLPVVPAYVIPVVNPALVDQASHWGITSVADSLVMKVGVNTQSFGVFAGTEASVMSILYIIVFGYILACVFLYGFHKMRG